MSRDYPFGRWLDETMTRRRISPAMLATISGVDRAAIYRTRHCQRDVRMSTAIALCDALRETFVIGSERVEFVAPVRTPRLEPSVRLIAVSPSMVNAIGGPQTGRGVR